MHMHVFKIPQGAHNQFFVCTSYCAAIGCNSRGVLEVGIIPQHLDCLPPPTVYSIRDETETKTADENLFMGVVILLTVVMIVPDLRRIGDDLVHDKPVCELEDASA